MMGAFSNVEIESPKLLIVLNKESSFYSSFIVMPCLIKLIVILSGEPMYSFM